MRGLNHFPGFAATPLRSQAAHTNIIGVPALSTNSKHCEVSPLGTVAPARSFTNASSFAAVGLLVLVDFLVGAAQFNVLPSRTGLVPNSQTACSTSACFAPKSSTHLTQAVNVPTGSSPRRRLLAIGVGHGRRIARSQRVWKVDTR